MRALWSLVAWFLAALCLCGCAQFHPSQKPGTVIVRTQNYDSTDTMKDQFGGPMAARVLPYALLAKQSYIWKTYDDRVPYEDTYRCDPLIAGRDGLSPCSKETESRDEARAMHLLSQWRYVAGCDYFKSKQYQHVVNDYGECPRVGGPAAEGLGVQLWVKSGVPFCPEAAIVFRGTVSGDVGDLDSDLHWLRRDLPGHDQYWQVHEYIGPYLNMLRHAPCYREGKTEIIAIGHSLGGGLAQLAAYSSDRIKRVYAVDPSMVIGRDTVAPSVLRANSRGIRMEYIYEHGEILAYPRYIIRQFEPPTACNPRIVTERFKLLSGTPIDQHSLTDFNGGLLLVSRGQKPEPHPFVLQDIPPCKGTYHAS